MKLNQNVGQADRIIRVALAVLFAVLYFTGTVSGAPGIILLVLGVVFLVTSIISFCPLYALFKLSTRK